MRSKVTGLIEQFNALNETEKQVFLDLVDPQPEPAPVKRTRKKRATSAPPAVQKRGLQQSAGTAANSEAKCGICGNVKDHSDHDRNYLKSHDFEPAKVATKRRSRKVESTTDTGAEVETETALTTSAGRD